jgi:hypothetical protein
LLIAAARPNSQISELLVEPKTSFPSLGPQTGKPLSIFA